MNVKQYLRQIWRLDNIINAKLDQVTELRSLAEKITSQPRHDATQVVGGSDRISDIVSKIVDLETEINKSIDELIDLKQEIMALIDSMPNDDYKLLLTLRYLNYKTWEEIAVEMNYTYRWIHVLHGRALAEFEKILLQNKKSA